MIRTLFIAFLTFACVTSATAQDRATPILALLDRLPLPPGDGSIEVDYGNPIPVRGAAMMAAALGQMDDDPMLAPILRAAPVSLAQRIVLDNDSLGQTHGIDLFQVEQFAMMMQGQRRTVLLDLPEGQGAGVGPALSAAGFGYQEQPFQGQTVFWRGADMETDLSRRDDFFGYGLGLSSRLWLDGDRLVQTATWPTMAQAIATPEGSVGQQSDTRALVSVLDTGLDVPGEVVALRLYLNLGWSGTGGPLMVADLIHGAQEGAVFAFVTDTLAEAERYATAARANWENLPSSVTRRTMAEMFGNAMQATALEIDGTAVAAITVHGPRDRDSPFWRNSAFHRFNQVLMMRDLAWLTD